MKPHEILGMVEETAGTRMYETKKVAAIKTIDKKQLKVDEINNILAEEITPTLERLRGEKQLYLKWSKNNADIERVERFVVANEFYLAEKCLQSNADDVTALEHTVKECRETVQLCRAEQSKKVIKIEEHSKTLNEEFGGRHSTVKKEEQNLSKELVQATTAWQNSKINAAQAQSDLDRATSLVTESKEAVVSKKEEIANIADRIASAKQLAIDASDSVAKLQADYQNMCAGVSSAEGDEGRTLPDQISKAHGDASGAETKAKQAKMKIDHLSKTIKVSSVCRNN